MVDMRLSGALDLRPLYRLRMPSLQRLHVSRVFDACFDVAHLLAAIPPSDEVCIRHCSVYQDTTVDLLALAPKPVAVRRVLMSRIYSISTELDLARVLQVVSPRDCLHLRRFQMTKTQLSALGSEWPLDIASVRLDEVLGLTAAAVGRLLGRLQSCTELVVAGCRNVRPTVIDEVAKCSAAFRSLRLQWFVSASAKARSTATLRASLQKLLLKAVNRPPGALQLELRHVPDAVRHALRTLYRTQFANGTLQVCDQKCRWEAPHVAV
jgi:hypothetical protein